MTRLLRIGDRVVFDEAEHQVTALSGSWVRLIDLAGAPVAVLLTHLVASSGFDILDGVPAPRPTLADHSLAGFAADTAELARQWERHIIEVETGLIPDAAPGTLPRADYDRG